VGVGTVTFKSIEKELDNLCPVQYKTPIRLQICSRFYELDSWVAEAIDFDFLKQITISKEATLAP
jgi:hypothetical protein